MNSWFVITGKTPALSLAELRATFKQTSLFSVSKEIVSGKGDFPTLEQLNRLGGIVKAGSWLATSTRQDFENQLLKILLDTANARIDFGLSFYDFGISSKEIEQLALSLKRQIKLKKKCPVRTYIPKTGSLSAVITAKELLSKAGREIIVWQNKGQVEIGEVKWVHQFESWSDREFGDKKVDAKSGLLPQKLARIMINLTGLAGGDVTIFDPFCGDGTVLMEAKELGFKFAGSDISPSAVERARQNVQSDDIKIEDARLVHPKISSSNFAIVTEPYLGPANVNQLNLGDVIGIVNQLSTLYYQCLKQWRSFLKPGQSVVMVFPVIQNHATFNKIVDRLGGLEYSTTIDPIRYQREGQLVCRDIVKLTAI